MVEKKRSFSSTDILLLVGFSLDDRSSSTSTSAFDSWLVGGGVDDMILRLEIK